jgi:hypothetical protein
LSHSFRAVLCDLRPRFIPKGRAGKGWRALARNGRVLLCSDLALGDLPDQTALVRLQAWHKTILPGDAPTPFGTLLVVRTQEQLRDGPLWKCRLVKAGEGDGELLLDVGGGMMLMFSR